MCGGRKRRGREGGKGRVGMRKGERRRGKTVKVGEGEVTGSLRGREDKNRGGIEEGDDGGVGRET